MYFASPERGASRAGVAPRAARWTPSIGVRLTLWGAGITLLVCVAVCIALYVGVYFSLCREVDTFLEGELAEFHVTLAEHDNNVEAIQREIRAEIGSRDRRDLIFRLLDAEGRVLASSDSPDRLPDPWPGAESLPHDERAHVFETAPSGADQRRARVCSGWTTVFAATPHILQVAYTLDRIDHSLRRFLQICGAALVLAIAFAGAGGYAIARRGLRPIERITTAARRISADNVGERLALSGTGDEIDRLAETLNAMLARIEEHVRRVQQFTADASHELRTPLAALRGSAEVALTGRYTADELRTVLEDNIDQLDRITRTAEHLLLLARFDAGDAGLRKEVVALDRLLEDVIDLYTPLAGERGIALEFTQRRPVSVTADGNRLRQVFSNLIDNAVKYGCKPGRVEVRLTASGRGARVEISDTGPGIPAADLPFIFDRFYRADPSRTSTIASGAGLGLAICRSIVSAHGGTIALTSVAGEGTTARVELPAVD